MKQKRPKKKTRREKKRFNKKTIVFILATIAIIGSFFFVMNHDYLAIDSIEIKGQKTLIEEDILKQVEEYLGTKRMGLVRRDNLLFLSPTKVEKNIRLNFPKIEEVNTEIEAGETLVVTIGERAAHSLWCINRDYESVFDEECYFSDKKGLLYARAPYFSGSVYVKLFIEPREDEKYINTLVDVIEDFDLFFDFLQNIESQYSIEIGLIHFQDYNDTSIEMARINNRVYETSKPVILYNQLDSYEIILRNIGIVINHETFKKDFALRASKLESVDVRFENRVLYIYTPEELEQE